MIVECPDCHAVFDDAYRWTFCPHATFAANDGNNNFRHHVESLLRPAPLGQRWNTARPEGLGEQGYRIVDESKLINREGIEVYAIKISTWQRIRFWLLTRYYAARDFFRRFE